MCKPGMLLPVKKTARVKELTPFALRMREAREAAGLSQGTVGKRLGLSQSTLSGAEKYAVGSKHTPRLAELYGVNAKWLASGEGPRAIGARPAPPTWPFERMRPEEWQALSERQRGVVEDAAVRALHQLRNERQPAAAATREVYIARIADRLLPLDDEQLKIAASRFSGIIADLRDERFIRAEQEPSATPAPPPAQSPK